MKITEAIAADDPDEVLKAAKKLQNLKQPMTSTEAPLQLAAEQGKLGALAALLEMGANPHHEQLISQNALGCAARAGQVEAVRLLLEKATWSDQELYWAVESAAKEAKFQVLGCFREHGVSLASALESGVEKDNLQVVNWCLSNGVKADAPIAHPKHQHEPRTALHIAARNGMIGPATSLIAAGADVNARDHLGRTPLMHAVISDPGRLANVEKYLAKKAADPAATCPFTEADRQSIIELLLAAGADAKLVDIDGNDAIAHLIDEHPKMFILESLQDESETYRKRLENALKFRNRLQELGASGGGAATAEMFQAIRKTDLPRLIAALAQKANPNARATNGDSALLMVARDPIGFTAALLDAGADPNQSGRDARPLGKAAGSGNLDVVKRLVQAGADVNLADLRPASDGLVANPLYHAVINGQHACRDFLIAAGAKMPDGFELPFKPGVEFPDTFVEAFVRAPFDKIVQAVAKAIRGKVTNDAWQKTLTVGKRSYAVVHLDGSEWISVLGVSGVKKLLDKKWSELIAKVSMLCNAPACIVYHEDTSGTCGYEFYEDGEKTAEFSATDGKQAMSDGQKVDGYTALENLAQKHRFCTLNYGPNHQGIDKPFNFEILGLRMKVADAAYVSA